MRKGSAITHTESNQNRAADSSFDSRDGCIGIRFTILSIRIGRHISIGIHLKINSELSTLRTPNKTSVMQRLILHLRLPVPIQLVLDQPSLKPDTLVSLFSLAIQIISPCSSMLHTLSLLCSYLLQEIVPFYLLIEILVLYLNASELTFHWMFFTSVIISC